MGEGFSEVIDQCPETLLVPSTCRRTEWMEFQSSGLRQVGQSMECEDQRSDGVRARERERKEIDLEYGVYRSIKRVEDNGMRYLN